MTKCFPPNRETCADSSIYVDSSSFVFINLREYLNILINKNFFFFFKGFLNVCVSIFGWFEYGRYGRNRKYLQVQLFIVRIHTLHVNRDTWLWTNYGYTNPKHMVNDLLYIDSSIS